MNFKNCEVKTTKLKKRINYQARIGFTLIELLIVVAIIAILALIAVPNFLEAQTRSKVSRTVSDMRSLAVGLEAYYADTMKLPPGAKITNPLYQAQTFWITTPVAYLTSIPYDIFWSKPVNPLFLAGGPFGVGGKFLHYIYDSPTLSFYVLFSYGPDTQPEMILPGQPPLFYDATNGTVSRGDIYRIGQAR